MNESRKLSCKLGLVVLCSLHFDAHDALSPRSELARETRDANRARPTWSLSIANEAIERATVFWVVRHHLPRADHDWCASLSEAIHEESVAARLDPLMVAAIIARESSFRTRAVSSAGAVGLMQLRPFVARELAARASVDWEGTPTLHEPQVNVRLGSRYFRELLDRFDGDAQLALVAYHRGPARLARQLEQGRFRGSRYADRVLALHAELERFETRMRSFVG